MKVEWYCNRNRRRSRHISRVSNLQETKRSNIRLHQWKYHVIFLGFFRSHLVFTEMCLTWKVIGCQEGNQGPQFFLSSPSLQLTRVVRKNRRLREMVKKKGQSHLDRENENGDSRIGLWWTVCGLRENPGFGGDRFQPVTLTIVCFAMKWSGARSSARGETFVAMDTPTTVSLGSDLVVSVWNRFRVIDSHVAVLGFSKSFDNKTNFIMASA